MTITHDALNLTVLGPGPPLYKPCPPNRTLDPLLVTSGGQDWIPVQNCSPEDLTAQPPPPLLLTSDGWLRIVGSSRYSSYWNGFFYTVCLQPAYAVGRYPIPPPIPSKWSKAGDTHPTVMHSCYLIIFSLFKELWFIHFATENK